MSVFFRRSCGAVLAYAVATQGALADLTANEVWTDWQSYFGAMGYTITGDESTSGDVTTISNMTLSMELPEDDGQFQMVMPEMTLTENGDGTVNVGLPENFPLTVSGQADGEEFAANVLYSQSQLNMVVSGSPEDMTYDYTADKLGIVLDSLEVDGEPLPDGTLGVSIEANDLDGSSRMRTGENRNVTQSFNAADMAYNITFKDPETDESALIEGKLDQLAFEGENIIPKDFDLSDPKAFYEAGFAFSGNFTYAAGTTDISGVSEGEEFSMASTSEGGRFAASIDAERIAYDLEQSSTKLAVTTADLPFPIEVAMANAGLKFEFPVQQSEEVQPFGFAMNLTDFTMSDVLWSMFDPAGTLPRDPATIALDTTGTAKVLMNIFDPEAAVALETSESAPGELHSLKINELLVSLVGAKLTGDGDFAFDNANTEEFDGLPTPSGVANLQLVGANALIDKLIGMGLLSDNDALGARMMMGMMAVPGEEPDTLNSTIEFTEDGQILANGQRLK
ncbi:DUF2125 domain-containing protein [Rhodobacteraceae bacterium B1Z28]|uniref:DUF2125 domain-containing protein n=1 Tax=Ruegeria haliotis TaxID=2747601 RepID=A0ABX2PTZ6_9RHOB|nr:DUF2125 domain-containing protein [Ruegeria haliotis]NVO57643.1 DUF2125 domain-containing protein [Ruegeria haliotis]